MTKDQPFDWRAHVRVHPAADLLPLLPPDELRTLADDMAANGMLSFAVADKEGNLLDGRNRLDALALLGVLEPAPGGGIRIKGHGDPLRWRILGDGDPYDQVLSLNIHRRHLTAEQKRELIAMLLKAKPEQSNRTIAKQVKADDKTVASVRREMEARSEIPNVDKRTDSSGRHQPATKAKPAPTPQTAKLKPQVNSKDIALERFDAHVLELIRLTKGQKPQRFAKTAVAQPLLGDLAHFLRELVNARRLTAETAEGSAEKRKAEYAASEAVS
jgi:hypothetical protein